MKIIIDNETKRVIYSFKDDSNLIFNSEEGFEPNLEFIDIYGLTNYLGGITESNSIIVEGVILPDDFIGSKYLYDSELENPWSLNPDWIAPEAPTEEVTPE